MGLPPLSAFGRKVRGHCFSLKTVPKRTMLSPVYFRHHMNAAPTVRYNPGGMGIVNVLLGVWVLCSPFVLGFSHNPTGMWNNVIVGIAITLVALAGGWGQRPLLWLVVPIGVWLFGSPFFLGVHTAAFVANNITLAFASMAAAAIVDELRSEAAAAAAAATTSARL